MEKETMTKEEAVRLLKERGLIKDDCVEDINETVVQIYNDYHSINTRTYERFNDLMDTAIFTDEEVSMQDMAEAFQDASALTASLTSDLIVIRFIADSLGIELPDYEVQDDSDFIRQICEEKME